MKRDRSGKDTRLSVSVDLMPQSADRNAKAARYDGRRAPRPPGRRLDDGRDRPPRRAAGEGIGPAGRKSGSSRAAWGPIRRRGSPHSALGSISSPAWVVGQFEFPQRADTAPTGVVRECTQSARSRHRPKPQQNVAMGGQRNIECRGKAVAVFPPSTWVKTWPVRRRQPCAPEAPGVRLSAGRLPARSPSVRRQLPTGSQR